MTTAPPTLTWTLSTDIPLLLLPVRLETRFAGQQLKIRIFPDAVHLDSHEAELTAREEGDARAYWDQMAAAGGDQDQEAAAWKALARAYGVPRAAWIARVMEPLPDGSFPSPATRGAAWTRAPRARALPSRWFAVGRLAGHDPVYGQSLPVAADLAVGPSPTADLSQRAPDQPPVDPESRWLVDFAEAAAKGMALTLDFPDPNGTGMASRGLDELLVFGVDETSDGDTGGRILAELLEAHASTAGLGYVPPGTPTNHTDSDRSGYDPRSPSAVLAAQVRTSDLAPSDAETNAVTLAAALGLSPGVLPGSALEQVRGAPVHESAPGALGRAPYADLQEAGDALAANTALWGATWGYYLPALAGQGVGSGVLERVRELYRSHVRAAGPLPTLRVGRQPYGVLPVLSLDTWADREGDSAHAQGVALLRRLRDQVWLPSVPRVPRIRPGLGDPDSALLAVLGCGESSSSLRVRSLLGNDYVTYLWRFSRLKLGDDWRERQALGPQKILTDLGLADLDPRVGRAVFSDLAYDLGGPLVDTGDPAAPPAAYLAAVSAPAPAEALRDKPEIDVGRTPLLYRLLRHAALTEYDAAARRIARTHHLDTPADIVEPELVDILPDDLTPTLWRRLDTEFTGPDNVPTTIGAYLASGTPDPDTAELTQFWEAVGRLAGVPTPALERHVRGAIDLATYRLDAWITGYASRRLAWMRQAKPTGIFLGGYGWVGELRPRPPMSQTPAPPGEQGTVYASPEGAGYVHAPSLGQATTAAVLRSAYRNHPAAADNPYAVDVSSRRARTARHLLDGIRQGQSLGALLGYRFERGLHDSPVILDQYLPRFRALAPVLATRVGPDPNDDPEEVVTISATVDGLALHRMREDIDWTADPELPDPGTDDHAAIQQVLDDLDDTVDALADVLLAESVHQAAQGNPVRAGASLDAAARGDAPPPDLEFCRTPRTGTAVTHRLLLLANPAPADPTDWPTDSATQLRAVADPAADGLAAALLPPPRRVLARLTWRDRSRGAAVADTLALDSLRLSALDYVLMPGSEPTAADGELVQRIRLVALARPRPDGVDATWTLAVETTRDPSWDTDRIGVEEFMQLASAVRRVLGSGHRLTGTDLAPPGAASTSPPPQPELVQRATDAMSAAQAIADSLDASDETAVRLALTRAAGLGIVGAIPPESTAVDALTPVAQAVQAELSRRLTAAANVQGDDPAERLRALFGDDFPALMVWSAPPDLVTAHAASTDLQRGDPRASESWLLQHARVRAGADRLHETLTGADALRVESPRPTPQLSVAQLPYSAGDSWVGLPRGAGSPNGARLSIVVAAPSELDLTRPLVGIAVDEWSEVIPNARETTGVTFEYDTPGAMAPQAMLLAVPSDASPQWSWSALEATLWEAFDLARIRAVDPDSLSELGQFLPAMYYPVNVDPGMGATDFTTSAATSAQAQPQEVNP